MNNHAVNRIAISFLNDEWFVGEYKTLRADRDENVRLSLLNDFVDDNDLDADGVLDIAILDELVGTGIDKGITQLTSLGHSNNQAVLTSDGRSLRRQVTDIIRTIDGCKVGIVRFDGFTVEVFKDGGAWVEC